MHKGQWMKKQKNMTATDDLQYHSVDIKNNPRSESHLMDSQSLGFFSLKTKRRYKYSNINPRVHITWQNKVRIALLSFFVKRVHSFWQSSRLRNKVSFSFNLQITIIRLFNMLGLL